MDTYILRLYRREPLRGAISGLAERVDGRGKQAFRTKDELWAFLLLEFPADVNHSTNDPEEKT